MNRSTGRPPRRKGVLSLFRLSTHLAKLEDRLNKKLGKFLDRHKGKFKFYIPIILIADYFYGMFVNSIRLGLQQTWGPEAVESIWVTDPIMNLIAIITPTGIVVTLVIILLACLLTKKGYVFLSGYKYTHDKRGFDIIPDSTHGSAHFMERKEMEKFLEVGSIADTDSILLGKLKDDPLDDDKYAEYVAFPYTQGLNSNILCIGAPGSGKTRGFALPFLLQCIKRGESAIISDPKGEIYGKLAPLMRKKGCVVRVFNLINMVHSDGCNFLVGLEDDPIEVQTVANIIIQNTNGPGESNDFWARAEINLLEALLHYVVLLTVGETQVRLPIDERSIGEVYKLLSTRTIEEINATLQALPDDHPAHGPHGHFLKAKENLWGNIAIGLGNRLAVFQSKAVDEITRHNDIDLLLPGQRQCFYFCVVSAQDSTFRFLSSLFFSLSMTRLAHYAEANGEDGRLPVTVNMFMEEYCNIGYLDGMSEVLASARGFGINCQLIVQSLAQYQHSYPRGEWETQEANCDLMIYLGANDLTTASFLERRCGICTISVTNNQMPLMPLFSPVYHSTRPYSQTRSNTQRPLMREDEILGLDNRECLVFIRNKPPMRMYKLTPEEHPYFPELVQTHVTKYTPPWRRKAEPPTGADPAGQAPREEPEQTHQPDPPPRPSPAPAPAPSRAGPAPAPVDHAGPEAHAPSQRPGRPGHAPPKGDTLGPLPFYRLEPDPPRPPAPPKEQPVDRDEEAQPRTAPEEDTGGGLITKVRQRDPSEVDVDGIWKDSHKA